MLLFDMDGTLIDSNGVWKDVDREFLARRGRSEVPLCAAMPRSVQIEGLDPADIIGIHTYCRDDALEIIDARYLTKVKEKGNPHP